MTDQEIVSHVRELFNPTTSPGEAFDHLFALRQGRVMYEDVCNALGHVSATLDVNEDRAVAVPPRPRPVRMPKPKEVVFKNPVVSFGKHAGKPLLEIADKDPGYLRELAEQSPFWAEQVELAKLAVALKAPPYRDTDATGYFDKP